MNPLVFFENTLHSVIRRTDDWGVTVLDLAAPPRRLWGDNTNAPAVVRTNIDPYQTKPCPLPSELLEATLADRDNWSAMTKRSLGRYEALFLLAEDPQRRLDARAVVTLAHQVSLVRHLRDNPSLRRVLIGDEVGLGKTVVAGLIIQELLAENAGLRILYLAPARLVTNVAREFRRLDLHFREWKAQDGDARLDTDNRIIASINRAVHPLHFDRIIGGRAWDVIIVDECHHLSDWAEGGGDPVQKYRLVRDLIAAQSQEGYVLLLSGTPHQAHAARFDNLLRLLRAPGEPETAAAGRVIYRTKEDVRDWDGNPLFPRRQVNPPIVVDLDPDHRAWLNAIHRFFKPPPTPGNEQARRAAGWKCAQALQWAASSPNAGLGYLVRQAIRAGWGLDDPTLRDGVAALRPYRAGTPSEPVESVYKRLLAEIRRQSENDDVDDIEGAIESEQADVDHAALGALIAQGVTLVGAPVQTKWERLWRDILQPAGSDKVVMFAQPIETVLALSTWLEKKTGIKPAIVIGGQSDAERDAQVERFRSSSGPRFLISSRAGGEGINLQFSRRLVHLDVPWNPMEMEQRVGRVHRFGSRETILVDTIVVRDSRETQAWNVARQRLEDIARTLVAPDRFESVFSRVMCLIPPEELQTVLIDRPIVPLDENEVRRLSALVDSGFRDWQNFHQRYAANQRAIRDQPAGMARWSHLREFLVRTGYGESVQGVERTRFTLQNGEVAAAGQDAEVVRLKDKSLRFVGDFDGGLFSGETQVGPLGLNLEAVAEALREAGSPKLPTGAAFVRWGDKQQALRMALGEDVVILAFFRQTLHLDSVGGIKEAGSELLAYAVSRSDRKLLTPVERNLLFRLQDEAIVRVKPPEGVSLTWARDQELLLANELRRPSEEAVRKGIRYAVWPILALHISP